MGRDGGGAAGQEEAQDEDRHPLRRAAGRLLTRRAETADGRDEHPVEVSRRGVALVVVGHDHHR